MISVLLPSRRRPALLASSVASLRGLAADPSGLEILVGADPDDQVTAQAATGLGCQCWTAPERYGYGRLHLYYNELAQRARGEWLLTWSDDTTMTDRGWDQQIEDLPPHVMVADLRNAFSPGLCCFPAVRRLAVDAVGCFSLTVHADSFWQWIGEMSGTIAPVSAYVHHARFDLTGQNGDDTWAEGRAGLQPAHFHSAEFQAEVARCAQLVADAVAAKAGP
jgi:hypothetical protein